MKEYLKISLLPKDTNMHGTIFGGVIMSYLDLAGAICARDVFDNRFVTVQVDEMIFHHPVFVGDLLSFRGSVIGSGPVDAVFRAIESVVNSETELQLYSVNAITSGTDAQGEVTVRLEKAGRIVSGMVPK